MASFPGCCSDCEMLPSDRHRWKNSLPARHIPFFVVGGQRWMALVPCALGGFSQSKFLAFSGIHRFRFTDRFVDHGETFRLGSFHHWRNIPFRIISPAVAVATTEISIGSTFWSNRSGDVEDVYPILHHPDLAEALALLLGRPFLPTEFYWLCPR